MKRNLLCLFYFGLTMRLFSQDSSYHKNIFFVEPIMNVGKSVKIDPGIFPKNDFCLLSELNFGWQTLGRKPWHHIYGFPQPSISLIYAYQGNDVVLGRTVAIAPNLSLHVLRTEKNDIEFRIGSGLAYFPVIHNPADNPANTFIGSHINGIVAFSIYYERKLSKKFQFKIGASTFHFSNGHYQLPNAGINSIVFTTGLKYFPGEIKKIPAGKKIEKEKYPLLFNVRFGLGVHDFGIVPFVGHEYMIYATSVYVSKRLGRVSNVQAGFMNKYYTNYYQFIVDSNVYAKNQYFKSNTFVIFIGHEFMCGRISFLTQGGINLYNPFFKYEDRYLKNDFSKFAETWFCSRVGFQYYFFIPVPERKFNIYAGIFVNTNYGRADYDEVSMGVSF
jgi:hypothetical protein